MPFFCLAIFPAFSFGQTETYYTHPAPGEGSYFNPHYNNTGTARTGMDCNNLGSDPCSILEDQPILHIPVNIHFVMNMDGKGNFSETGDGDGGTYNGYQRAEDIVNLANEQLEENYPVWAINPTPEICDFRIRLALQGVYFHRTNYALISSAPVQFNHNNFWSYINQNLVNASSEVSCFFFNGEIGNSPSGQANGAQATILFDWFNYTGHEKPENLGPNNWYRNSVARTLLHEIFHNNGLWKHPFQTDDCDDTPTLPGCWSYVENGPPPCNDWANISNNLMDYNQWIDEWSLSPCQICRLHNYTTIYLIQDDNEGECAPLNSFFALPSRVCLSYQLNVWMDGSASYNETEHFIEIYQVPSVGSNDVISGTYQSNWFDGKAGRVELGDYLNYNFGCGKVYRVKLAVSNDCYDWDEMIRYVTIDCACDAGGGPNTPVEVEELFASPNPSSSNININYKLNEAQNLTLTIHDVCGGQLVGTLKEQEWTDADPQVYSWNVGALPDGLYFVRAVTNTQVRTAQFSVQH
ncbi:MAG: T9SS C-terminal target domain-containing protein [Haliscomenobacteraceae bacterium CHB4]|nr:T9SS C-terminal target domain-containing protein [Haliscomenobacteraceae bacterium CHB4]